MTKIFESDYVGYGKSAEKVTVYALDCEDDCEYFLNMTDKDLGDYFGVYDSSDAAMPGGIYFTYDFKVTGSFISVYEKECLNV